MSENWKLIFENETRPGHDDKVNEKDDGSDEGEDADGQDCSILLILVGSLYHNLLIFFEIDKYKYRKTRLRHPRNKIGEENLIAR